MSQITISQVGMNLCVAWDFSEKKIALHSSNLNKVNISKHPVSRFLARITRIIVEARQNFNKLSLHFKKIYGRIKIHMPWLKMVKQELRDLKKIII